jgi:hypothetical protein
VAEVVVMVIAAAAVVADFDVGGVHRGREPKFVGNIEAGGSPQRSSVLSLLVDGCHDNYFFVGVLFG